MNSAFQGEQSGLACRNRRHFLAVKNDTTLNALAVEAFNDLLKKHGQAAERRKSAARLKWRK
jgi:Antitoxin-like ribbon-helix-helix